VSRGHEVRCGEQFKAERIVGVGGGDGEAHAVNPAVCTGAEHCLSPYLQAEFGGEVGKEVKVAVADRRC
jgi:hypothetical protein